MKRLPRVPLIVPVAVLSLALVTGEGWMFQRSRSDASRELAALQQRKLERDSLAHQSPALSPEYEAAVSAGLAAAGRLLAERRSDLQGEEPGRPATPLPTRSVDAFFELTDCIGQLRAKAGQAQVVIRPDERFGFAVHANAGPVPEQIAAVRRQWLATRYLVETLLESRPLALLAVRRERPAPEAVRDQRNLPDDFFEVDHTLSLRQPGLIESEAFRLEFTGQTGALRQFLNLLGASRQPFVVRSVEVEPLRAEIPVQTTARPLASGAPVPLVRPMVSKFGITVELVRLATTPATAP